MGERRKTTMGEGLGFYKEYVAGMMAGLAIVAVGHSFDTVKVKGLYRGATSSFLGMAFESSLMFGIYSLAKLFLRGTDGDDGPRPDIIVPSAMFGGAIISFVLCPTGLVKCRMQIHGTDSLLPNIRRYNSPLDCAVLSSDN